MDIVRQYRNLPPLTHEMLVEHFNKNFAHLVKDIVFITYYASFCDGEPCTNDLIAVVPIFFEADCTEDAAKAVLSNQSLTEFLDWLSESQSVNHLLTSSVNCEDTYVFTNLEGDVVHTGSSYLYYSVNDDFDFNFNFNTED